MLEKKGITGINRYQMYQRGQKSQKGYHKLLVWARMMELIKLTYELTKILPSSEQFGLVSQMCRAAISVISNFVEGYEKQSVAEKRHFLEISETPLSELEAQSEVCLLLVFWSQNQYDRFEDKRAEVGFLLYRYRRTIH